MSRRCHHQFVDGFGAMGDALTCCHCGLSKYPEALSMWSRWCLWRRPAITERHPQYDEYMRRAQKAQVSRSWKN